MKKEKTSPVNSQTLCLTKTGLKWVEHLKSPCYAHVEVHNIIMGFTYLHTFKKNMPFLILYIAAASYHLQFKTFCFSSCVQGSFQKAPVCSDLLSHVYDSISYELQGLHLCRYFNIHNKLYISPSFIWVISGTENITFGQS